MKKSFSSFIRIFIAAFFSLTLTSCSDIFNSRNGTLSISLPSARTGSFLPDMEPEVYLYDFEVRNNAGIIIYKSEELTPEDNISISDIEPGRYSVVIKAYTVDGNLKYANYSREKFVNVKAGTPTQVTIALHEIPDITFHYYTPEEGYEIMGNIDPSHFGYDDGKFDYNYSIWKDFYTLSYDKKAYGVVPVTITSNDFDFLTYTFEVNVKIPDNSPVTNVTHWNDLSQIIEAYIGTTATKEIHLGGSFSADTPITVTGNIAIIPDTNTVIDRTDSFTDQALFIVEPGASLTLGGSENYTLTINGKCSDISNAGTGSNLKSQAPLLYSYGNLTIADNCTLQNNYNSTTTDSESSGGQITTGGAICTRVKTAGDTVSLTLKNCTIDNCYSARNGGAIWAKGLYTSSGITGVEGTYSQIAFTMDNAQITNNISANNGGAMFLAYIDGVIKNDSHVQSNTAGNDGGGIYLSGGNSVNSSTLIINENGYVNNNEASSNGGGIFVNTNSTLIVSDPAVSLQENTAKTGSMLYLGKDSKYNSTEYSSVTPVETN